jgi:hypothetical protein
VATTNISHTLRAPTVRAVLTAMEAEQIDTVWKKRWMRAYSEHAKLGDAIADAAQHPAHPETEDDDQPLAEPLRLINGQHRPRRCSPPARLTRARKGHRGPAARHSPNGVASRSRIHAVRAIDCAGMVDMTWRPRGPFRCAPGDEVRGVHRMPLHGEPRVRAAPQRPRRA